MVSIVIVLNLVLYLVRARRGLFIHELSIALVRVDLVWAAQT